MVWEHFYANARSIVNKVNLLELEMYQRSYDLIVLTETHLDHSILDSEIFPPHFTVFRKDRKINGRHGGGVLFAVRDYITVSLRPIHPWTLKFSLLMCYYLTTDG